MAAPAIEVVELDDCTPEAAELGLPCTVSITRQLSEQVAPRVALQRLHEAVLGTPQDPALDAFRAVALRGERPSRPRLSPDWSDELARFISRVRVGIGGVSEGGTMLALPLQGTRGLVMMICHLGFGILRPEHGPAIVLTTADAATPYIERMAVRTLR